MSGAGDDITLSVRVIPRSSRSEVVGERNGVLTVKLNSPPVDGAANEELTHVLAKHFGVPRRRVSILGGLRSKSKVVRILSS